MRDLADAIGVVHAGDVDALHDRSDLIAKVGEEEQWIGRIVGDTRNQSRDQNLARHHASVQFVHPAPPIACRLVRAIWTTSIPRSTLLATHAQGARHLTAARHPIRLPRQTFPIV